MYLDNHKNEKFKNDVLQAIPFWSAAISSGILAVLYAWIFGVAEDWLFEIMAWKSWVLFILAPVGFVLSWWLVDTFAPYSKGSGVPQVMAAIELSTPRTNHKISKLLSFRIIVIKIISSFVLVFSGGVVGREGPTIQIAGSVFRKINEMLPHWWPKISRKNMIITGAAAGLSAAFNTPMGGIVFAMEELTRSHMNYFKSALFTGVIIAGLTAQGLGGSYLYLGYPTISNISLFVMIPVILVAIISGVFSTQMCLGILKIVRFKNSFTKKIQHVGFLVASGLIVATIAFFLSTDILGSGKELIEHSLYVSHKDMSWYTPILRMLGSALAFTSGGAGGVFSPALSAGASIGTVFSEWMNLTPYEARVVILAGMVAFLTGVTRDPFTSAILVLEMTNHHNLIFHLILSGMVASFVARMVSRHSLYEILKEMYFHSLNLEYGKKEEVKTEKTV